MFIQYKTCFVDLSKKIKKYPNILFSMNMTFYVEYSNKNEKFNNEQKNF